MKKLRYLENLPMLQLNADLCIGCGACHIVCPHRVFQLKDKKAVIIDPGACMECKACAKNCPAGAIFVNPDKGCGCAAYIINSWFSKITEKNNSGCSG